MASFCASAQASSLPVLLALELFADKPDGDRPDHENVPVETWRADNVSVSNPAARDTAKDIERDGSNFAVHAQDQLKQRVPASHVSVGVELGPRNRAVLSFSLLFMGMSAFPVTETLLLQTAMFTRCFDWEAYYGLGTVSLFLPGLAVQLLQNKYDQAWALRKGSRRNAFRQVVAGHCVQILALGVFLVVLHLQSEAPQQAVPGQSLLMMCTFVTIGLGCSVVYGTCAQLVALFSEALHPFFFVGTYSVSVSDSL